MKTVTRHRRRTRASAPGFSLTELLVVLLILGFVALLAGWQIGRTMRRARLDGAASDVSSLLLRASNEMKFQGHATFVQLDRVPASGGAPAHWAVRLIVDSNTLVSDLPPLPAPQATNDNGVLDFDPASPLAADRLVQQLDLPDTVSFSTASTTQIATANWSTDAASSVARYLICDNLSRTTNPGPPSAQIQAPATMELTLNEMVPPATARLTPPVRFQFRLAPVWSVTKQRAVYTGGTWK